MVASAIGRKIRKMGVPVWAVGVTPHFATQAGLLPWAIRSRSRVGGSSSCRATWSLRMGSPRSAVGRGGSTRSHSVPPSCAARRRRGLLDADVHQLAAHGALRPCVVAGLPNEGLIVIGVHTPRVHLRARASTASDGRRRNAGSTTRWRSTTTTGVERLRQPLLAGALLRRRGRQSSATSTSARAATSNRSA